MISLTELLQSNWFNIFCSVVIGSIWGIFAYAHLQGFQNTQNWSLLLFCFSETLVAGFYIFRSEPKTVSVDPFDWLVAIAGTFAPFFFRPTAWGILPEANMAILVGICIQVMGLMSLNRSIAIVAAKREIKSEWMYRIVRHPIYASYCIIFTGYLLSNTSLNNFIIYVTAIFLLCMRIFREEKHLALDPAYRTYMGQVHYRLIPYIF
jgi:protein-S-isoprenylcysteine O-methyltransferase Ste14